MNLLYIVCIVPYFILNVNGITDTDQFASTIEAVTIDDNRLCLGDCVGKKGSETCVMNYEEDSARCKLLKEADNSTSKLTKKYRAITGVELCSSNCGKFNDTYEWCVINVHDNVHDWRYCTRHIALKGVHTYSTHNKLITCTEACVKGADSNYWCNTILGKLQCYPNKKVIVFNFFADSEKDCVTPCVIEETLPYCYDTAGEKQQCYLNPDSTVELSSISAHVKGTRAPGVYTTQGYRRCKSAYRRNPSLTPLSIEDIAKKYEENFPTVETKYLDPSKVSIDQNTELTIEEEIDRLLKPDNMISDETDPVKSYTVYNTFSELSTRQVNLPLVIRAVITNRTIQREFHDELTNQFNELQPLDDRENYDERGYFIPTKLGGRKEFYNIFPQAWRHRRGALSGWWYLESALYTFINTHPNSYAEYTVVVTYNPKDFDRPFRPTAVGVRVRLYHGTRKQDDGSSQLCDLNGVPTTPSTNELENMYFLNDPEFFCFAEGDSVTNNFA